MAVQTNYGIYFSKAGTTARLPINPEEIIIEMPTENTRYNVLDKGEIIIPRLPNLQQISWESFLPGSPEPYVLTSGDFKAPEFYINIFESYQLDRKPVRFIINRYMEDNTPLFDTNMEIIVEEFTFTEKAGETGDFYYTLKMSEYRDFTPQVVTLAAPPAPPPETPAPAEPEPAVAVATPQRQTSDDVISVGDTVIANGSFWYSSWGARPFGTANNRQINVTRIIQNPTSGQNYPILIGNLGWVKLDQLRKVS